MELSNLTAFPMQVWDSFNVQRHSVGTLLVRGKFRFVQQGKIWHLKPLPDQGALNGADQYWGEPGESSVRHCSDYIPGKPGADIILNTSTYAPGRQPATHWVAGVETGDHRYHFSVSGQRYWKRQMGWWLTAPEPCTKVPVRYEHAFGGTVIADETADEPQYLTYSAHNPVGCGLLHARHPSRLVRAPQIETIGQEADELQPYRQAQPAGLGAIARSWAPRLALAGTYDDHWLKHRHPYLPLDFQETHYHDAHPGLILPRPLLGNEQIVLRHLCPEQDEATIRLPALNLLWVLETRQGHKLFDRLKIDTVFLDIEDGLEQGTAYLSWRTRWPVTPDNQRLTSAIITNRES